MTFNPMFNRMFTHFCFIKIFEQGEKAKWKITQKNMDFICSLVFAILVLFQFSVVVSVDNALLGFNPVATLQHHCLVDPSVETPNLFENNSVTVIGVQLFVNKINELEPVSRTLSLSGILALSWFVPCVKQLYENETNWPKKRISSLNLKASKFWKPPFYHRNGYVDVNFQSRTDLTMQVYLDSGSFAEYITGMFTMLCSFDFRKFPFDTQSCSMHLLLLDSHGDIQIGNTTITMVPMAIDESIDWELVKHTTSDSIGYDNNSDVFLTFTFKRKPYYYVVTLTIPGFALHCLILVSYFLPPETTDRTVFAATVELAFYFFQIEFNRALPQSSIPIYMQVYLIGMLIGCTLITIYSAILCYIANVNSKLATKPIIFNGKQYQLIYVVDFFISIIFFFITISLAFIPLSMCFI